MFDIHFSIILCMKTSIHTYVRQTVFYYIVHEDFHTYICSTDCFLLYCACRLPYIHMFDRLFFIILCMQTSIHTYVRQTVFYYIVHADFHTYYVRQTVFYYIVHADFHTYICSTDCFLLYCACRHSFLHTCIRTHVMKGHDVVLNSRSNLWVLFP